MTSYGKAGSRAVPAALLCGLAACASLATLEPPDVTLHSLEVVEITTFETTLVASLRFANPNPDPLALDGVSFKLKLDGRKVGRGMTAEPLTIDRLSSGVLDVTFHVNNAALLLQLAQIVEQEAFDYALTGAVYVDTSLGRRKLKVERQGRLDKSGGAPATSSSGRASSTRRLP